MANPKKNPTFSLSAFIEQTAQMLRNAIQKPSLKKRKKEELSAPNKIEQIAFLLRSEAKKSKPKKKKSH